MKHKSGFVGIIGNSNVGKSTLINTILKKKISITTHKIQTTKHRILGILNHKDYQVIFSDTPGITINKNIIYNHNMNIIKKTLEDSDIILYITDYKQIYYHNNMILNDIFNYNTPTIFILNKVDNLKNIQINNFIKKYQEIIKEKIDILPISALKNINITFLLEKIINLLPIHPPFYPKDFFTDKPKKFFVNEIIREKIFLLYNKEIPYSLIIKNEIFKEEKSYIILYCNLYIKKINQKIILIGKNGNKIRILIEKSTKSLEKFFNKKIFLYFFIKIK